MLCKMTEGADVSDIANISVTVVGVGLDRPAIEYRAFGLLLRYGQDRTLQLSTNISFTVVRACNAGKNIKTCFLCHSLVIVNHI